MAKEERRVEVEGNEPLPVAEGQLVDGRARMRDDRAAADGVDQDVDRAEFLRHRRDEHLDLGSVEGVGAAGMGPAARRPQRCDGLVEPALVVVDADHDRPFAGHDVGGGAPDAAGDGGDERDSVGKPHVSSSVFLPIPVPVVPAKASIQGSLPEQFDQALLAHQTAGQCPALIAQSDLVELHRISPTVPDSRRKLRIIGAPGKGRSKVRRSLCPDAV